MNRTVALASVAVLILLTSSVTAQQADVWVGTLSNEWELGQNWLDDTVPIPTDDVIVDVASPRHPILSKSDQAAGVVTIGESMLGQLDVLPTGVLDAERFIVGAGSSAVGELNVSGIVTTVRAADSLVLARDFGASGTFTLSLNGEWLGTSARIGALGKGTAYLRDKSIWNLNQQGETNVLLVGDGDTGHGDVFQMGMSTVNAVRVELGASPGAIGSYELRDNSLLNLATSMRVGVNGVGHLSVSGGTLIAEKDVFVGSFRDSSGTATIGVGGLVASRQLVVGDNDYSNGTLNQMGGSIFTTQDYILGAQASATGTVHQTEGTTTVGGNLLLTDKSSTSSATYTLDGGVLDLGGGDVLFNEGIANFNYTAGILRNVGTFGGPLVHSGGTLSPGEGVGTMVIQGNFDQGVAAIYEVEIDGARNTNDLIDVRGAAVLGGDLELVVRSRFPVSFGGVTYKQKILTATAGVTEPPPRVTGPYLEYPPTGHIALGLFLVDFSIVNNSVVAEYFQALEGDTNGDGDVDITDFNTLAEFFDPVGENVNDWPEADFDQNNLVDLTDFNFLATNYAPDGYFGREEAVPEPASWLLALGTLIAAVAVWRHVTVHGRP